MINTYGLYASSLLCLIHPCILTLKKYFKSSAKLGPIANDYTQIITSSLTNVAVMFGKKTEKALTSF